MNREAFIQSDGPGVVQDMNRSVGPDPPEMDIKWIIAVVRRRLWMILFFIVLFTGLAAFAVMQLTPKYRAEARIFFEGDRLNVVQMEEFVNRGIGLEDQIQLILSENVLSRVVDDVGLVERPEFNPTDEEDLGSWAWLSRLGSYGTAMAVELRAWLAGFDSGSEEMVGSYSAILLEQLRTILTGFVPVGQEQAAENDVADARRVLNVEIVRSLRDSLSVKAISSRVLSISVITPNPDLSAAIVNATAERFIIEQLNAKLETTRSATEWLSARTIELEEKVRTAEAKVEEARAELSREAGQSTGITEAQVKSLNGAISEQQARIPGLDARYKRAREVLAAGDFAGLLDFRDSPRLRALRDNEADLLSRQRSLRNSVGENHPAMRSVQEQLAVVEQAIQDEAERITGSLARELQAVREAVDDLAANMRVLEVKSLDQSRAALRVRQLEREAQASRILYESLLSRLQETAEQQKLESSDARIISRAEPPSSPESQKKSLLVAGGGAAGGAFGVGLAFLFEFFNTRFRHPHELEEETGYPVLGALPVFGKLRRRETVLSRPRTRRGRLLTESVRDLRTSIMHTNIDAPPKVIMFTSATPGDGKSTTSLLTALANQEMGKRTIVVECDLRRPTMYGLFHKGAGTAGLVSVLTQQVALDKAIFTDVESGLDLLAVSPREMTVTRRNPADILASQRFRTLLEELRGSYDHLVLDAPPVLAVTDARVIAPLADAMVFVVKWNATPRAAVKEGIKQLERVRAPLIGLCMNSINEKQARRFSSQQYGFYSGDYSRDYV